MDLSEKQRSIMKIGRQPSLYLMFLLIIASVLTVLFSMIAIVNTGQRMAAEHGPQIEASMEIQKEAALAHMWFEEMMAGDRTVNIAQVWKRLDQCRWYAAALLEGGENPQGRFVPLEEAELRGQIEGVVKLIDEFRSLTEKRYASPEKAFPGSDIDQQYDAVFQQFLDQADQVEARLKSYISADLKKTRRIHLFLIFLCVGLAILVAIVYSLFMQRHIRDEIRLRAGNQQLEAANQQLHAGQQQLRAANQQLRASEQQLQAANQQLEAANEQLQAGEQQLQAANQQLRASQQQLRAANQQLESTNRQLRGGEQQLLAANEQLEAANQQLSTTEQQLRIEKEKALNYLDIAGVILVAINEQRKVTLINKKGCQLLGREPEDIIGRDWFDNFVPESIRAEVIEAFEQIISGQLEPMEYFENPIVGTDGQERTIAWHNRYLKNEDGHIVSTLSSGEDITERRRTELERERLITELESKNAELERFSYTVSHDLKSPLITIKGFLGLLERDAAAGDDEKMKNDISVIAHATDQMQQLLDELLELSRIGQLVNPPENVSLVELTREVVEMMAAQIARRGVLVEISAELPVVYGDRIRLREVIQNLLDNAIKFMDNREEPRVEVGACVREGQTVCYVRDNGIGIEPRYHEKIFGLFNQLDQDVEGTGVGLALVRRIVEVHGGRIWVESEGAGTGTTFYFTIPPGQTSDNPKGEKAT